MKTPYQVLGEDGIRTLTNTFYDHMDSSPEFSELRSMHAPDLTPMKEKLADYLIGWMGGPPVYAEKHGGVCMTKPHSPYTIGAKERDDWLACMQMALTSINCDEELQAMLKAPLYNIADAVRNNDNQ